MRGADEGLRRGAQMRGSDEGFGGGCCRGSRGLLHSKGMYGRAVCVLECIG